jgi:hypothetical protein
MRRVWRGRAAGLFRLQGGVRGGLLAGAWRPGIWGRSPADGGPHALQDPTERSPRFDAFHLMWLCRLIEHGDDAAIAAA